jgi:hypothetical protein
MIKIRPAVCTDFSDKDQQLKLSCISLHLSHRLFLCANKSNIMTTITKTVLHASVQEAKKENVKATSKFMEEAQYNYFFLISFVILTGSCLGGIAAMYILKANAPIWQLITNIYLTMACNVACIGQVSAKWVIRTFVLSALANIVLLLVNVL